MLRKPEVRATGRVSQPGPSEGTNYLGSIQGDTKIYNGPLKISRPIADSKSVKDPTVSLCMIVKDEEKHIGRCLASLKGHVDEMIIVDTGSTDKTIEIAKSYGAKVFHHPWEESFSKARNQAMSHVTTDWIIQLDADEEMDPESAPKIRQVVKSAHGSTANLLYLVLKNRKLGETENVSIINTGKIMRMSAKPHYENIIHNKLVCEGDVRRTGLIIYHYGYNLSKEEMDKKKERTTSMLLKQLKELPDDCETHYYLGIQYLRYENWMEAIKYGDRAIKLFKEKEPKSQLLLLCHHIVATSYYHLKELKRAEEYSLEALKIYSDYIDSTTLLTSIYFATEQYEKCAEYSKRFFNILNMLNNDNSKALVIPLNTLKNAWLVWTQLGINHFKLNSWDKAIYCIAEAEKALIKDEEKYKPSFMTFKYLIETGNNKYKKVAEEIYKKGYRPKV